MIVIYNKPCVLWPTQQFFREYLCEQCPTVFGHVDDLEMVAETAICAWEDRGCCTREAAGECRDVG